MILGNILGWLIVGLLVGAFARLLVPGRQDIGIALTVVLGVIGALVGGFISTFLFGPDLFIDNAGNTYTVVAAWPGWIMAIVGATLVLWVMTMLAASETPPRTR